jgi:hypothetical protein
MRAIRFGVLTPRAPASDVVEDIVHATLTFTKPWFANDEMACRIWIKVNDDGFVPAHIDGITIRTMYEDTTFVLAGRDDSRTVPLAIRWKGRALPAVENRPRHRGEFTYLKPGKNILTLRIRTGIKDVFQDYEVDVPDDGPMHIVMVGDGRPRFREVPKAR